MLSSENTADPEVAVSHERSGRVGSRFQSSLHRHARRPGGDERQDTVLHLQLGRRLRAMPLRDVRFDDADRHHGCRSKTGDLKRGTRLLRSCYRPLTGSLLRRSNSWRITGDICASFIDNTCPGLPGEKRRYGDLT